jgi:hypothetical protein
LSTNDTSYDGFHVYGSKTAFKFENVRNSKNIPVLSLDAANKSGDSFDWETKISFQITPAEMPDFVCCLFGITLDFKAEFHGPKRDKSFRMATQSERSSMYAKVWENKIPVGIEITPDKVFHLGALSLKILGLQSGVDVGTCITLLRCTAGRLLVSKNI